LKASIIICSSIQIQLPCSRRDIESHGALLGSIFEYITDLSISLAKHIQFDLRTSPCAKICSVCPLPAKANSYTLATERHNVFQTRDISIETPGHITSRRILSCLSKFLCISIAMSVTCTRGGTISKKIQRTRKNTCHPTNVVIRKGIKKKQRV
jgi:hypothetical protein